MWFRNQNYSWLRQVGLSSSFGGEFGEYFSPPYLSAVTCHVRTSMMTLSLAHRTRWVFKTRGCLNRSKNKEVLTPLSPKSASDGFPAKWAVGSAPTGSALETSPIRHCVRHYRSSFQPLNIDIVLLRIHTASTPLLAGAPCEIIYALSYRR